MPSLPDSRTPPVQPGDQVGHYEIVEQIGSGGMGVVYSAVDLNMDRREVALKCPWPDLMEDRGLARRFLREIRIVSQLSHPNIVPVYETFVARDLPWLSMQLVRGTSLSAVLARETLPVQKVLSYTEQAASALESAHKTGILHRDISPKNMIIAEDDRVFVTDFGLAKILRSESPDATETTQSLSLTPPGAVLGTLPYMSPEQILGKSVDERSDVFSLGTTIYEMCTGTRAFSASNNQSLIDVILHEQPEAVSRHNYDVPLELERIIRKCLAKRPEERYQGITDLLVDVRNLRREQESGLHPVAPASPRRWLWALGLALAASAVLLVMKFLPTERDPLASAASVRLTRGESWEGSPAISPDGKQVAYVSNDMGNLDIYVTAVAGGQPLRITRHPGVDDDPSWFPDGSALIYVSDEAGDFDIWKVGPYGGAATRLLPNAMDPQVSPDGTRLAFTRTDSTGLLRVGVTPLDDFSQARMLTGINDGLWHHSDPTWSPDGQWLCYAAEDNLWVIPASGGRARPLIPGGGNYQDPAWSPDGKRIYFSSFGDEKALALWWVPSKGGTPRRFTLGTGSESHPSLSRDGLRMAYSTGVSESSIGIMRLPDGDPHDLPGLWNCSMPALSPSGDRLVFVTARWGAHFDLWFQDLEDGKPVGQARRLYEDPKGEASHPAFSPDGHWIAYYRILGEERDIWILPAEGGQPTRFTEDPSTDVQPAWSPDGRSLAFVSGRDGALHIWTAPVEDGRRMGQPIRLTDLAPPELSPSWSPDGRSIAYVCSGDIWTAAADHSTPPKPVIRNVSAMRVRWLDDETLLATGYWEGSGFSIRQASLVSGITIPLSKISMLGYSPNVILFDVSRGGNLLAFTKEDLAGDVWILDAKSGD